jgi:hypothetical protein
LPASQCSVFKLLNMFSDRIRNKETENEGMNHILFTYTVFDNIKVEDNYFYKIRVHYHD